MYRVTAIFPNGDIQEVGVAKQCFVDAFLNERRRHNSPCIFVVEHLNQEL